MCGTRLVSSMLLSFIVELNREFHQSIVEDITIGDEDGMLIFIGKIAYFGVYGI